ncbi:MAG: methyltransferase type 11 [Verrucomicrobiales bacterium]|nr:methyltransferase type 11 [Verrucomicrobiales bacterium]|tara:strand:+ start:8308 stop:9075 length:768 start_codon:yes stop_codon:yes gene_type:complete
MKQQLRFSATASLAVALFCVLPLGAADKAGGVSVTLSSTAPLYQQILRSNIEGIGKFYMGRQISHVMGHQGAAWLERPEREREENTSEMIKCLKLKPGDQVADIGVGTGYIARRMAKVIGPKGTVFGVDIQPEMLELLDKNMKKAGITNVRGVRGTISDPKLAANSLDFVIMVDVYHEFSHPYEMMRGIVEALKPGGRVAFVEYRAEDPKVPIKRLHKMSEAQVKKEASLFQLKHVETYKKLPWQHVIFFQKVAQ